MFVIANKLVEVLSIFQREAAQSSYPHWEDKGEGKRLKIEQEGKKTE